jgi:hypothetical protein
MANNMKTKRNLLQTCLLGEVLLPAILLWLTPAAVKAQFDCQANNGTATITRYTGPGGAVVIPSSIYVPAVTNFLPVTSIGDWFSSSDYNSHGAFERCTSLTSVAIPETVTNIGGIVFYGCTSLTNVVIPDSLISIGGSAFYLCTNLTTISMGNHTASIGDYAFGSCFSLTNITFQANVASIGEGAFRWCSSLFGIILPNIVKNISPWTFYGCSSLASITIPNSVTNIGYCAFQDCTNLASITIPNSVTTIGSQAFQNCTSLATATIGNGVTNIGSYAFNVCRNLAGIYFQGNAIGDGWDFTMFSGDDKVTIFYFPETTGWRSPFNNRPALLWNPQAQSSDASFGVKTNRFGFNLIGSSNLVLVVEASTDLENPVWQPVSTNKLNTFVGTNGTSYFSDPQWMNYPGRFYRLRSP